MLTDWTSKVIFQFMANLQNETEMTGSAGHWYSGRVQTYAKPSQYGIKVLWECVGDVTMQGCDIIL